MVEAVEKLFLRSIIHSTFSVPYSLQFNFIPVNVPFLFLDAIPADSSDATSDDGQKSSESGDSPSRGGSESRDSRSPS